TSRTSPLHRTGRSHSPSIGFRPKSPSRPRSSCGERAGSWPHSRSPRGASAAGSGSPTKAGSSPRCSPTATPSSSSPARASGWAAFRLRPGDGVRADLARELEEDVLERAVERLDLGDAPFPEPADDPANQGLGSRRAGGEADALDTVEPGLVDLAFVVDQVGVHAAGA